MAIDDTTRLAYVEVLPDEQQGTAIGFLSRALTWFNGHGVECRQVMSDNGSTDISKAFAKACSVLKLKQIRTRSYTPRINGMAKRFILTHCKNGPTPCRSRTPRSETPGCLDTWGSITI